MKKLHQYVSNLSPYWRKAVSLGKTLLSFSLAPLLWFDIKLVGFFTETKIGFALYLLSAGGMVRWTAPHYPLVNLFCGCLFLYVLGTTTLLWISLKIPPSREMIHSLVGREFVIAHLGCHSGSKGLYTLGKVWAPLVGLVGGDILCRAAQSAQNRRNAEYIKSEHHQVWADRGFEPSFEERMAVTKDAIREATRPVEGLAAIFGVLPAIVFGGDGLDIPATGGDGSHTPASGGHGGPSGAAAADSAAEREGPSGGKSRG